MDRSFRTASVSDFNVSSSPDGNYEPASGVIHKNQTSRLPPALSVENLIGRSNASTFPSTEALDDPQSTKTALRATEQDDDTSVFDAYRCLQLDTGIFTPPVAWSSNNDRKNQTRAAPRSNSPLRKSDESNGEENGNTHIECSDYHRQKKEQPKEDEEISTFEEKYQSHLQSSTRTGEKYLDK